MNDTIVIPSHSGLFGIVYKYSLILRQLFPRPFHVVVACRLKTQLLESMIFTAHITMHIHVYTCACLYVYTHIYVLYVTWQECVSVAFQKADDYRRKFEPYRDFYQENEKLDVEKLKEEDHG